MPPFVDAEDDPASGDRRRRIDGIVRLELPGDAAVGDAQGPDLARGVAADDRLADDRGGRSDRPARVESPTLPDAGEELVDAEVGPGRSGPGGGLAPGDDRQSVLLELDAVPGRGRPARGPLGEGHGLGPDLDDRVPGRGVFRPDVGPTHDPGQAFEIQGLVPMAVSGEDGDRGDGLEPVQHDVSVGDASVEGIVRDEEGRLPGRAGLRQDPVQPADVLGREVAVPELHDGPLRDPDEPEPAALEGEAIVPPDPPEIRSARLRPFRVVVAGDDVIRNVEPVEDVLGRAEVRVEPHVGDVAGHQDEGDPGLPVDVGDRGLEVVGAAVRSDVGVAQPGEPERGAARRRTARSPRRDRDRAGQGPGSARHTGRAFSCS